MSVESPDVCGKSGWSEIVGRHQQFLLDHIDPDFGLLTKLVSNGTLSYEQQDDVNAEKTVNKRNRKLLEIVRSENKWDALIDVLRSSNQTHVVRYLEADGKYSSGDDWPLGEREENILRVNLEQLINLIEAFELLSKLYTENVINRSQREFIQGKRTSSKQNEALIKILRRRSIRDYNKTIHCLKETNQTHIAQLLKEGGAFVEVHVSTDAANEAEGKLADMITGMIVDKSMEECGRILELVQFKVVAAKTGQSVILFVYLHTTKQLNRLKNSLRLGSLKDCVQLFFNAILSASKLISVSNVTIAKDELSRVEEFLLGVDRRERLKTVGLLTSTSDGQILKRISLETLHRHNEFLKETIDPDYELLHKQFSPDTLTGRKFLSIDDQQPYRNKIEKLLEYITDQDKCDSFIDSLRKTGQAHIVNYLIGDGTFRSKFGGIWPVTDNQRQILKANEKILVNAIEVDDNLMSRLHDMRAISQGQKKKIDSKANSIEKAKAFLEMLPRMSQIAFRHANKCVCDTNQNLRPLDESGVILRLQINSDAPTEEKVYIVRSLRRLLHERSTEGSVLIPELKYLITVKVEVGQRFVAYIKCTMQNEFQQLQHFLQSGKLKDSFERLFGTFLIRKINVFSIEAENEGDARNFFEMKMSRIEMNDAEEGGSQLTTQTSIDRLPLELLDFIRQKCYLCCTMQRNQERHPPHRAITTLLASVNFSWFRGLMERNFKHAVSKRLFELHRHQRRRHFIIRNNNHYFESSLQSPNRIRYLKFCDCITDVQAARIQRQRRKILTDKAGRFNSNYALELLEIVKSLDESRYSTFIRCLRQSGLQNISRIASNGGATIPLNCWIKTSRKSQTSDMADKLRSKLKETESQEAKQLQSKLRELDTEILDVYCDRAIVCWIWCHSTRGLEKLQAIDVPKTIFPEIVKALNLAFKLSVNNESFEKFIATRAEVDSDSPLTDTRLKIINATLESLVDRIAADDLVGNLLSRNVINLRQKELIDSKRNFIEKNKTIFHILRRLSKKDYALAIDCFYESTPNIDAHVLEGVINLDTLVRNKKFLEKTIDPDSGLLDILLSTHTLTEREIRSIQDEPTCKERNAKLLKYIIDHEKHASFFDSLRISRQTHVVNQIIGDRGDDIAAPLLIHEIETESALLGNEIIDAMEILESELFVVYSRFATIEVYDTSSYQLLRKLQIPNISNPWDMTASKYENCLFVIGFKNDYGVESIIVKFDIRGKLLGPWPKPSGGLYGHIAAYETSLIVCLRQESVINEFSQNGNLIRSVQLSSTAGITHPFYAIKVSSMHYIVSHGYLKDDPVGICVVDIDGNLRKACTKWNQRPGRIDERHRSGLVINGIIHIIEDDKGSLLLADLGNNKIFMLSSTLEYKKTLIQFSDEELPETLSFDKTNKRLFVATNILNAEGIFKSSRVLVYDV